jgi:hypothetical protein
MPLTLTRLLVFFDCETTELEKKIDKMVYKLYDLTEEEITIIEGKS